MASPSVTHTLSNGSVIDAGQLNTNFTDIINSLTDATKDLSISALTCAGNVSMNGNVTIGNATGDDVTITGSLASTIPIKTTYSYNIGSATLGLAKIYFGADDSSANTTYLEAGTPSSSFGLKLPDADGASGDVLQTDASGQLSFVGGASLTASKTANYTATTADKIIPCDTNTSGAFTVTLYAATGNAGRTIKIIKTTSDTNVLTIDGNGSETINGSTTYKIADQYEFVELVCDGSNWLVVAKDIGKGSSIRHDSGDVTNPHGTTANKIRLFSSEQENIGGSILYASSTANGSTYTIQVDGFYSFTLGGDRSSSGGSTPGISLNTSQTTTGIFSITSADRLAAVELASGIFGSVSWTGFLSAGDVVRFHDGGSADATATVTATAARLG